MLEKNLSLLPWQVDSILQMTVRPLGAQPKNNTYGTGRVSAYQAVLSTPSGLEVQPSLEVMPKIMALGLSVPNPAKGSIAISYDLPVETGVSLKVYNLSGQLVRSLVSGKEQAGYKHATWDGRSERGARVASGVYFYRLVAGSFAATKKMIVIR
jgi:hypothetical protein